MRRLVMAAAVLLGAVTCAPDPGDDGATSDGGGGVGGAGGIGGEAGVCPEAPPRSGGFEFLGPPGRVPPEHEERSLSGTVRQVEEPFDRASLEGQLELDGRLDRWALFDDDATGDGYLIGWSGDFARTLAVGEQIQLRVRTGGRDSTSPGQAEVALSGPEGLLGYAVDASPDFPRAAPGGVRFVRGPQLCPEEEGSYCLITVWELQASAPDRPLAATGPGFEAGGLRWTTGPLVLDLVDVGSCDRSGSWMWARATPL